MKYSLSVARSHRQDSIETVAGCEGFERFAVALVAGDQNMPGASWALGGGCTG